jgi:hypothetical protein
VDACARTIGRASAWEPDKEPAMHNDGTARAQCNAQRAVPRETDWPPRSSIATHNERRRGQRPKSSPGIADVPLHHNKRPAFASFSACLIRQQAEYHCQGLGFWCQVFVRGSRAFAIKKSTRTYVIFFFGGSTNIPISKNKIPESLKPALPFPPSFRLQSPMNPLLL